jgi:hypothetical protein
VERTEERLSLDHTCPSAWGREQAVIGSRAETAAATAPRPAATMR